MRMHVRSPDPVLPLTHQPRRRLCLRTALNRCPPRGPRPRRHSEPTKARRGRGCMVHRQGLPFLSSTTVVTGRELWGKSSPLQISEAMCCSRACQIPCAVPLPRSIGAEEPANYTDACPTLSYCSARDVWEVPLDAEVRSKVHTGDRRVFTSSWGTSRRGCNGCACWLGSAFCSLPLRLGASRSRWWRN